MAVGRGICSKNFEYSVWLEHRKESSGNDIGEVVGDLLCEGP